MKILQIVFLACLVSKRVQAQLRLVLNTTCLELSNPSNKQFRLSCIQHDYQCLLDETLTREFEVCRDWKWIPEGHCAYFNTYGEGNIDGRPCPKSATLVCPTQQYSSAESTKYTACYAKQITSTIEPRTRMLIATSNRTFGAENSTYFPISKINDELERTRWALLIVLGSIIFVIPIAVIFLCIVRPKICQHYRKGIEEDGEQLKENNIITENVRNLSLTGKEEFEDECARLLKINEEETKEVFNEREKGSERKDLLTDERRQEINEDMPAETSPASTHDLTTTYNENEESQVVFDDTVESLKRSEPHNYEQEERELCTKLYNLLFEGRVISEEVLVAIVTRKTGKSIEEWLADETVVNRLKEILSVEFHRYLTDRSESEIPIPVFYNLLRIYIDEEHYPTSGWGNPVREEDTSIGDDVERLCRIYSIVHEISNPVDISVDGYARLIKIMKEALTRLDPNGEFIKDFEAHGRELFENERLSRKLKEYGVAIGVVATLIGLFICRR